MLRSGSFHPVSPQVQQEVEMHVDYGTQRDFNTGNYFFMIYGSDDEIVYESETNYPTEEEADSAAIKWVQECYSR